MSISQRYLYYESWSCDNNISRSTVRDMKYILYLFCVKKIKGKKKIICRTQYNALIGKTGQDEKIKLIWGMFDFLY